MAIDTWAGAALGLLAGAATGWLFFRLLVLNTQLYTRGKAAAATAVHLGRLGGVAAVFIGMALLGGAVPLLALLAGFLAVRPLLMRRYGRA